LRTAYTALPRDELLQEIREGHVLTRAAALAFGGGRLDVDHLPLIFQWIEDKDPEIQKAAIQTLSHFGEAEAVAKLVHYAKRNVEPLSTSAIESLAGSRFGTAHDALLLLLKNEPPESKKRLIPVLARYPRPIWSESIYEFTTDSRSGLNLEALKALVEVGHPKLVDVLESGLKSSDAALRDFAFQTLSKRSDERSEKLSIDFTLNWLKDSPPTNDMVQLLTRTKDQRALPLLTSKLDSKPNERLATLGLLIQMGDRATIDTLVEKYDKLNTNEKTQVLNGLRQFKHPKFRELAGAALQTNDGSLINSAANALSQDGSAEAEKLVIEALEKQTNNNYVQYLTNALSLFGTSTARAALLKAKDSNESNKKQAATSALASMRARSPAYQMYVQAMQLMQAGVDRTDKKAKEASEKQMIELLTQAIQTETDFPEAYAARGKVYLRQNNFADAGKDFEKALELKLPQDDGEVVTGLALARVVSGRLDDAVKLIEDNRAKFVKGQREGLYEYNCACVYSRAVQYLNENEKAPDRDKKRDEYRKKSLADLELSIKSGFDDFDWMAEDPDFVSIREDAQFKALLSKKPATPKKAANPKAEE
jgi:HEAT repeat protein